MKLFRPLRSPPIALYMSIAAPSVTSKVGTIEATHERRSGRQPSSDVMSCSSTARTRNGQTEVRAP